jgi:multifunctional beta-oxidation protein
MRKQKYGRVILVTSVNGLYGQFGQTNYSSAKSAMLGFGKALAKEGAKLNIKVNVVAPGAGSAMTATVMPEELVAKWKPDYVAPTIAFLCHEDVPCSGCVFESGGGWTAQVKYTRTAGHFFDLDKPITPEDVKAKWSVITDFSNATDPEKDEISPQMKQILASSKL